MKTATMFLMVAVFIAVSLLLRFGLRPTIRKTSPMARYRLCVVLRWVFIACGLIGAAAGSFSAGSVGVVVPLAVNGVLVLVCSLEMRKLRSEF